MDSSGESESAGAKFNHFDLLPVASSDHHYLALKKENFSHSLHTTIMKEWAILEKNLPESIYAQAYEDRIDLLRAVIIGSPETPYYNGLFFFDIVFPQNYPNEPPKVHYQSRGYRINPNLYANGMVCLSLIHTWPGENVTEEWTKDSTILQLLVSIQGLVLNRRPYFNEPCYSNARNSLSNEIILRSVDYNFQVLVDSCKTMLLIMKKPPKNFEDFVAWHFEREAEAILGFVKSYVEDRAWAGQLPDGATRAPTLGVSTKQYKISLKWLRSDLKREFAKFKVRDQEKLKKKKKKKKTKGLLRKLGVFGKCILA